ncbi:hypothetical protein EHW66_02270 [Erwinia psidii]|uniref:hypothetical protein n=1 Tax=Erwinia psidii TaxID=69224 RepID=UPI00226B2F6F|nr:hypothetical protein [Erwinia psidii]MCX8958051.1 hypothetical protein [Erwinia psidii]MCX8963874.1 hypothetical protein [Erwinia psidii]
MTKMTTYRIPLDGTDAEDPEGIRALFENNAGMFEEALLSSYAGDIRYSMLHKTFQVSSLSPGLIKYRCQLNFYAGCTDQNETFDEAGSVAYQIEDNQIVFALDETIWHQQ